MAINLGKELRLTSDKLNVILERKRVNEKTNEEYWVAEGYYPSYKSALKALVNREVQGIDDVKKIVRRIEEIERWIESLEIAR